MFTVRTAPKEKKKKKKKVFPVWKIYILLVSSVQRRSKICRRTESSFVTTSVDFKWFPFMLLFFIFPPLFPKPKPLTAAALLLLQCLLHFKHCRLHTARLQHCPAWRTCLKWSWCADRPLAQRHLEGGVAPRPHSKLPIAMEGFSPFIRTWSFHTVGLLGEHLEMGSTVCLGTWRPVVRRAPDVREEKIRPKKTSMFTFFLEH